MSSLLGITFLLISCSVGISGNVIKEESQKNPEVYFCPKDNCSKVFERKINDANFSVHCAIYDINLKNVINSLSQKSKIANVKVVIDNANNHGQIKGNGLREDSDKQL